MESLSRRQFLHDSAALAAAGCALCSVPGLAPLGRAAAVRDIHGSVFRSDAPKRLWKYSREAMFYEKSYANKVACLVCPNHCELSPGDRSVCRTKINLGGRLYSIAYGNPCSANVDPVEKKPLFHFKPRTKVFSIATTGCNLRCLNCQNWEISQAKPEEVAYSELFPIDAVKAARATDSASIAYTYSEPVSFYEYMYDTACQAKKVGVTNLMITNGYINTEPLGRLCPVIDAANVNLKSFSDDIYRGLNGGRLDPVLSAIKTFHERGVHLEITNLLVPGYTDSEDMARRMCAWILKNVGADHPLHFLRFFPKYKLDRLPPTPISTLIRFRELAMKEGVRYVYVGNVPEHEGNNTYCHSCRKLLVERRGYSIPTYNLEGNRCRFCRTVIPGVWA